jgi:hypothetical protein
VVKLFQKKKAWESGPSKSQAQEFDIPSGNKLETDQDWFGHQLKNIRRVSETAKSANQGTEML